MKKFMTLFLTVLFLFTFTQSAFAETSSLVYEGETYYTKQTDNPAADLQPGEQIDFTLSDNIDFVTGTYKLTVVSCGNRESITIKVNGIDAGTISRAGTGFGMDQMSYDVLDTEISLSPEDTLSVCGQKGEYWGWVDSIQLELIKAAIDLTSDATVSASSDTTAAEDTAPKTGVEFPAYLLMLSVASCLGLLACSKIIKKRG